MTEKTMPRVEAQAGEGGVVEVVGARPDIEEDQRPEVDDRQAVGEDRPIRGLGQEVVHDAEERGRQKEADRIVAVPPLHERVLDPGVDRIAAPQPRRHREVVEDMEKGDGDDGRDVEPDRDVDVALAALGDGAEDVDREDDPHHRDGDVDRPLELGVLLALGDAQRQGDGGGDDDQLPAPEVDGAQGPGEHPGFQEALYRVVDAGERSRWR